MPQSRAEIQKRYREKMKRESRTFMQKERERKRTTYVPVSLLTNTEIKKRRNDVLERVKLHNMRKKQILNDILNTPQVGPSTRLNDDNSLKVALEFKRGHKKGNKNAAKLKQACMTIETLRADKIRMFREKKRLQKRIERLKKKEEKKDECEKVHESLTPKSRTKEEMKDLNITPRKRLQIRKKLLFANVLQDEIKSSLSAANKKKIRVLSMKVVKKYRGMKSVGRILNIDERTLKRCTGSLVRRSSVQEKRMLMKVRVETFLEREDNSTTMPGKNDTIGREKVQKRVLNDYLHNLYAKFMLENPGTKISKSKFCQMRPKHVLLANFCNRTTCLCSRHQNMALKLRALKPLLPGISKNPDTFIATDQEKLKENLQNLNVETITYTEWKKVEDKGKQRWKQIQTQVKKDAFICEFMKNANDFYYHVQRVKTQYAEMRKLRNSLPEGHVLAWMDFAENFTCSALEEVQSAYWTSDQVTLHTSVIYFPSKHNKSHKSIVGVSEVLSHNSSMVYAMIQQLVPMIKEHYSGLTHIHYLTDSPTSQYRNKAIFQLVCDHADEFGVSATWDYLEAGHGKGPCDGLGGSVKRAADMSVRQGKAVIQGADDFFAWAKSTEITSEVIYYYVTQDNYETAHQQIQNKTTGLKVVPGTMRVHAVAPINRTRIAVRDTSCNCQNCINSTVNNKCEGWRYFDLKAPNKEQELEDESSIVREQHIVVPKVGTFVSAIYDTKWYVGLVTAIEDDEVEINFMQQAGKVTNRFKWPSIKDEIWLPVRNILSVVPDPQPSGKTKRLYEVNNSVVELIDDLFKKRTCTHT